MITNQNIITVSDAKYKQINQQKTSFGTTIEDKQDLIFFITALIGTGIKVEDKDTNTVINSFTGSIAFTNPLKLPGGFKVTGTNVTVQYFWI